MQMDMFTWVTEMASKVDEVKQHSCKWIREAVTLLGADTGRTARLMAGDASDLEAVGVIYLAADLRDADARKSKKARKPLMWMNEAIEA